MSKNVVQDFLSDLIQLGLKEIEAKALLALLQTGGGISATKIAEISGVHRTVTYQALNELIKLGVVENVEITGSANTYRLLFEPRQIISIIHQIKANPVEQATRRLEKNIDQITASLKEEEDIISEIRLIKGRSHVLRVLKQLTRETRFQILSNVIPDLISPIIKDLELAKKRGVKITLILTDEEIKQIEKLIPVTKISSFLTGADVSKIRDFIPKSIPEKILGGFKGILTDFESFLKERPNIFLVDPESKNKNLILLLKSTHDSKELLAVQTINLELINSFSYLMRIIVGLASSLKSLQTNLTSDS